MSEERIGSAPKQKLPKNKKLTIVGVVVVVIVVAGMGFWTWHNSPSFCSAFCHTPMNSYVETYDQQAGAPGTDKWGNEVSNSSAMLVVSHKEAGQNCLSCHEPIISQQIGEVQATLTGDYYYPLEEANLEVLMQNSGNDAGTGEQFCLKSGCHVNSEGQALTKADLTEMTSDMVRNPHSWHHDKYTCSDCHKSHGNRCSSAPIAMRTPSPKCPTAGSMPKPASRSKRTPSTTWANSLDRPHQHS